MVAPVLHVLPDALEDVSVTLPPEQKLSGPPADTVGALGNGLTVTLVLADVALQPALPTVTE